ncbi:hypothetical protein BDR03DRAFT_982058 [Suillus americanus]|nr:hypothetical protein BDR03DRAFT_982058 [Suillus americanus]
MPQGAYFTYHPVLDGSLCDAEGNNLPPDQPPDHPPHPEHDTWHSFPSRSHFELANFIFHHNQMPAKQIDNLMQVLAHFNETHGRPPFNSNTHLYDTINSISSHNNDPDAAVWKCVEYNIWYQDPFFGKQGQRVWTDLITGNWAWGQCNTLADDPDCHGAMFVPVILSSNKTTVSVVTGQNDYYPLYVSAGNLYNNICCAHQESQFPRLNKVMMKAKSFETFAVIYSMHHYGQFLNLFIMQWKSQRSLSVWMATTNVQSMVLDLILQIILNNCYYHALFKIGVHGNGIADSKKLDGTQCGQRSHLHMRTLKQGFLALDMWFGWGIIDDILPFTTYFLHANIHKLLAPNILHQIIKGTFKDHLIKWVDEYLVITYGKAQAELIWADIDHRY